MGLLRRLGLHKRTRKAIKAVNKNFSDQAVESGLRNLKNGAGKACDILETFYRHIGRLAAEVHEDDLPKAAKILGAFMRGTTSKIIRALSEETALALTRIEEDGFRNSQQVTEAWDNMVKAVEQTPKDQTET